MKPLAISNLTVTSCLGAGRARHHLDQAESGLRRCDFPGAEHIDTWIGRISGLEQVVLPEQLARFDCRNHRLAWHALQQDGFLDATAGMVDRYGPARVGVIVGTSTSGIEETERLYRKLADPDQPLPEWYRYYDTHNAGSLARFVSAATGAQGYQLVISTACSSSAKVFASAARALQWGICDAVVVGGVDTLCLTTLCGFSSLQLTAADVCRPCDAERAGISIGEAGGFAILSHEQPDAQAVLLGYGESADAHHMSSPHPEGAGAKRAMRDALTMAGLDTGAVGYVNLHGTGTPANDVSEAAAVSALFGNEVPCSSTKGFFGHTLGACGILEAAVCIDALQRGVAPRNVHLRHVDPAIPINVLQQDLHVGITAALSNSFGFGGSNCSLLFGAGS